MPARNITGFEAVFDLENVEAGWLLLDPNRVPDMKLVRRGEMRPEAQREAQGRLQGGVIKLSRECSGNNEPVRELLGSAKELCFGIEWLLRDYNAERTSTQVCSPRRA